MSFLSIYIIDNIIIILSYEINEFNNGLRFSNSKLRIFSNGIKIHYPWIFFRYFFNVLVLIFSVYSISYLIYIIEKLIKKYF